MGPGRRVARSAVAAVLVLWVSVGTLVVGVEHHLWSQLGRVSGAFTGLVDRPEPGASGSLTFLVVLAGPDRPGTAQASWLNGSPEGLLLVHLDAERRRPVVVALPLEQRPFRDALGRGGPALLVGSVETATGVRVEHLMVVEWEALATLTDHVGGVPVSLTGGVTDPENGRVWTSGVHRLDGAGVLAFVSQRRGLPHEGADRAQRQMFVLRALLDEALEQEMRKQPRLLYSFLDTMARGIALDDSWSLGQLRGLAWSMRGLRSYAITYVVVESEDQQGTTDLWQAMRDDTVDRWLLDHAGAVTPDVVA
jgi:LCP family protein required for cell wall assembly